MVDTHAHLGLCESPDAELLSAARAAGVRRILSVGLDARSNREVVAAAEKYEEVFACVGRHPNSAAGFDEQAGERIAELTGHPKVVAVGETGLDFYRDGAPRPDQRRAFEAQIEIAREAAKPLVIHMRNGPLPTDDATSDTLAVLAKRAEGVTVVLHCFSVGPSRVPEVVEHGWYCSFAGNLTYPRASELREAAALVPDDLLLVETDSPFLTPQPWRGRPNQPANVVATAEVLAAGRDLGYAELERLVEANAARAFGW